MNEGAVFSSLNVSDIPKMQIKVPPLHEQHLIAEFLGDLDALVEANTSIRKKCDLLGAVLVRQECREVFASWAAGEPLRNWTTATVEGVSSVIEAGTRPQGGIKGITSGIPSIGAESIDGLAVFDFAKVRYVPDGFAAKMRRGVLGERDLLVYKDGGKPGVFKPHVGFYGDGFPYPRATINEHVFRVNGTDEATTEFLYFWLSQPEMMSAMAEAGTGVAVPGMNRSAFGGLPVAVPSLNIADRLFPLLWDIVGAAIAAAREARQAELTRDELLPLLLSGEVRVQQVAA